MIGAATTDEAEHDGHLRQVIAARPQLLLDNGGDLFVRYLAEPYPGLLGGTEETTSGRMRLRPLAAALGVPVLVINDSPIKQFAENRHAVGQSVLESYLRITNQMTNGRRVAVFGYGACGKGVAANFRNACASVAVVEIDPVTRLEASLDGFAVPGREEALRDADVVITVTGAESVITADDLGFLKDGVVLMNAGHFPREIAVDGLARAAGVVQRYDAADGIETLRLDDGRRIHLLTRGHMANLAGPRPLGNSIESMDLGFALQARCLEAVAAGSLGAGHVVVPVPRFIDELVATSFLDRYGRSGDSPRVGCAGPGLPSPGPGPCTGRPTQIIRPGNRCRSDHRRTARRPLPPPASPRAGGAALPARVVATAVCRARPRPHNVSRAVITMRTVRATGWRCWREHGGTARMNTAGGPG